MTNSQKFFFHAITTIAAFCKSNNIPFDLHELYDGYQLRFPWFSGDVIIHSYSYGGEGGSFETMGFSSDNDDVRGYLTAEQVCVDIWKEFTLLGRKEGE